MMKLFTQMGMRNPMGMGMPFPMRGMPMQGMGMPAMGMPAMGMPNMGMQGFQFPQRPMMPMPMPMNQPRLMPQFPQQNNQMQQLPPKK